MKELGFKSFREARNVIGYALGSSPESIKNYRDEFDPLFPNPRKGWHKRPTRNNCLKVFEEYKDLDLASFTNLVRSFVGYDVNVSIGLEPELDDAGESAFARRLATGLAAEQYFASVSSGLSQFHGYQRENTTMYECGYDFRFRRERTDNEFLAVEVKGLMESAGTDHDPAGTRGRRSATRPLLPVCGQEFPAVAHSPDVSGPIVRHALVSTI